MLQDGMNGGEPPSRDRSKLRIPMERRYHITTQNIDYPPEVSRFNSKFTSLLETIKRRHDPTVSTVAQGVLEWKKTRKTGQIGLDIQSWLDRFYMSRIGIRFLIGQRLYPPFGLLQFVVHSFEG
jgi:pyruvate dehydrogenase kinase 2/3/4